MQTHTIAINYDLNYMTIAQGTDPSLDTEKVVDDIDTIDAVSTLATQIARKQLEGYASAQATYYPEKPIYVDGRLVSPSFEYNEFEIEEHLEGENTVYKISLSEISRFVPKDLSVLSTGVIETAFGEEIAKRYSAMKKREKVQFLKDHWWILIFNNVSAACPDLHDTAKVPILEPIKAIEAMLGKEKAEEFKTLTTDEERFKFLATNDLINNPKKFLQVFTKNNEWIQEWTFCNDKLILVKERVQDIPVYKYDPEEQRITINVIPMPPPPGIEFRLVISRDETRLTEYFEIAGIKVLASYSMMRKDEDMNMLFSLDTMSLDGLQLPAQDMEDLLPEGRDIMLSPSGLIDDILNPTRKPSYRTFTRQKMIPINACNEFPKLDNSKAPIIINQQNIWAVAKQYADSNNTWLVWAIFSTNGENSARALKVYIDPTSSENKEANTATYIVNIKDQTFEVTIPLQSNIPTYEILNGAIEQFYYQNSGLLNL